ncbi:MAG: AraC family transcriptional regulator [Saprospiraceae bacterium]|nr:AraC family transcriptional regulator [Saprospiraceae bacterium]
MLFDFNLKSSFLLIFFINGLVFSGLLFEKGILHKHRPSIWLACFTLLCVLYISPFMLGYAGWYSRYPYREFLFYFPFQQLLLIPPVLYFYFKGLLDESFQFQKKDVWHFVPALLYLIYTLIIWIADQWMLNEVYFYADEKDKDFDFWYQLTGFLSLIIYLFLSLKNYKKHKLTMYDTYSYADGLVLKWAQGFLMAMFVLMALRILFFIFNPEWGQFGKKFWYYMAFSGMFYYISIKGYFSSIRSLTKKVASDFYEQTPAMALSGTVEIQEEENSSTMASDDLEAWKLKIEKLMSEVHLYADQELSTFHLARTLDTHPKKISQVINKAFGMNFNDYINQYRTKAFIGKIQNGEFAEKTLLGLAMECGFNSKSTFNRSFKKQTSMSPKVYLEHFLKKGVPNQDLNP